MNITYKSLDNSQKTIAVQRLTALWAFSESGLGGVMHAFQIPFTGLFVGGMAIIMITMIAELSGHNYKQILKSALIVLIVKAMVSPHTPPPAYLAVGFQALLGYSLFNLFNVNFISILFLSVIAMLESAIQKLLILTLFFGESLWKAIDGMVSLLTSQFGLESVDGSYWIISLYLLIYVVGGFLIAWVALRTTKVNYLDKLILDHDTVVKNETPTEFKSNRKNKFSKLWMLIGLMLGISVLLFFIAPGYDEGWVAVLKTVSWTLSAILIWYLVAGPLLTKAIQRFLQKKQIKYGEEVLEILSFIPVLRQLTTLAWQYSKLKTGMVRWSVFISTLIHSTLIYTEHPTSK